jgi:3-hydroxybutyryl-CoA dehydratase
VTEADVLTFAELTGDHHPQHVDAQWAADSAFGGQIAHGLLIIGLAGGLIPFDPERVVALRRVADVVFKRPVRLGDTISVHGKVAEATRVSDEAGLVTFIWTVANQHGETVCRARLEVLWRAEVPILIPL